MHSLKTLFRKFNGRDILKRLKLCLVYNDREVENALSLQYFRLFFLFLAREHSTYKKKSRMTYCERKEIGTLIDAFREFVSSVLKKSRFCLRAWCDLKVKSN